LTKRVRESEAEGKGKGTVVRRTRSRSERAEPVVHGDGVQPPDGVPPPVGERRNWAGENADFERG
jgi:hypothetical protein